MIGVAWVFVTLAVLLVPSGRRPGRSAASGPVAGTSREPVEGDGARSVILARAAVVSLGCACVVGFGLPTGAAAAAVLCPLTSMGLRALRQRPTPLRIDRSVALALDLTAAALRTGRPLADALIAAAPAADAGVCAVLLRVAGLLRLGADAEQAWEGARDGPLRPVAVAAVRSAASGMKLATAFERVAAEIRAEAAGTALARAHRAGVIAIGPLGVCFLPSFVCLGIVPVVVGVAATVTGVLP